MSHFGKIVATGTWYYGGREPREIVLQSRPAHLSASRFIEGENGEEIDESLPIPQTLEGHVYYVAATDSGEFDSISEAKKRAEMQPWGPIKWSDQ